jgi:TRAP-type C4-dicarboxylate transport system permease large subunit
MNADTAGVLTAVFPLVLIAFMAERRNLTMKARRSATFRRIASYAASASILGLVVSVVGVQTGGLASGWGIAAWGLFALAIAGLFSLTGMHMASAEVEEDRKRKK